MQHPAQAMRCCLKQLATITEDILAYFRSPGGQWDGLIRWKRGTNKMEACEDKRSVSLVFMFGETDGPTDPTKIFLWLDKWIEKSPHRERQWKEVRPSVLAVWGGLIAAWGHPKLR